MKPLLIASLCFFLFSSFCYQSNLTTTAALTCSLQSDKTKYKVGELPDFKVELVNNTGKDIYLLGSLDGSDVKWRMPYCYFTIQKPKPDTVQLSRCGNMNTLKPQDFRLVKAGAKFNPYESIDEYGFFTDYTTTNSETFKNPGIYKIKFHYSTNSQDIKKFMGDRPIQQDKTRNQKLITLLKQVPKVDAVSNEIEIVVED